MDSVFRLESTHDPDGRYHYASLHLPATDYELLDAMEKLQLSSNDPISIEVFERSVPSIFTDILPQQGHLAELNAYAKCLAGLSPIQATALEGLIQMEKAKSPGAIPLETLCLLASTAAADCCLVASGVTSDAELGRFYAENGFINSVEDVSDEVFEMLDFEKLGKQARTMEDGVFVAQSKTGEGGYVVGQTSLDQGLPTIEPPRKPDYAILLKVSNVHSGDPADGTDKVAHLALPATPQELDKALDTVGARDWREAEFRCLDCCAPALTGFISGDDNIAHINRLAQKLAEMDPKQLTKFKAVIDAAEEHTVLGATQIAFSLSEYLFSPQYTSPEDMAKDFLKSSMGDTAAEQLLPFVDLHCYGRKLMENQACVLTDYGMVSREDGQSLKPAPITPKEPARGGMTMQMQ